MNIVQQSSHLDQNGSSNDYHHVPATEKQIGYAKQISQRAGVALPWEAQQDHQALSRWRDTHKTRKPTGRFSDYPSSKQVAFAERIA